MKKAIFLDIDGTLIDCFNGMTEISPKVKTVIRSLQSKGDYVFIATGRPYAFLSQAILEFGFDGFILANGAQVIINNKTIYSDYLKKDFLKDLISKLEKNNIQYILQSDKYSYIKKEFKELYDFYYRVGISGSLLKNIYSLEDINVFKIEMLCLDEKTSNICLDLISNNSDYSHVNSIDVKAFELYLSKNTKATGILKALEYLKVDIKNSYAFGDGKNDIEMLSTVGCGIAMGNACDEVKKYAKKITDTVYNDGVAVGIEKYVI